MGVPENELGLALQLLWQLEWLAGNVGSEPVDDEALPRQPRVAHVLFVALDDRRDLATTRRFLQRHAVDLAAILAWYQPGTPVVPWQRRAAVIDDALVELRPWIAETVDGLGAPEAAALEGRRERFMAGMNAEAERVRRMRR